LSKSRNISGAATCRRTDHATGPDAQRWRS